MKKNKEKTLNKAAKWDWSGVTPEMKREAHSMYGPHKTTKQKFNALKYQHKK